MKLDNYNRGTNNSDVCDTNCSQWKFDQTFGNTIIEEFELVCDKAWLPSLSQSIYQSGYAVNGLILGYLSDRYGRRPVLWLAVILEICGGLSVILSNSMTQYIVSRFFLGLGDSGRGFGSKHRANVILLISFGSILGFITLPGAAYLTHNYRYLQLIPTLVALVLLISWLWSIPESPRWLLCKGDLNTTKQSLMKCAKINGQDVTNFEQQFGELEKHIKML
ncbi:unnamed protein product [Medioppia subpectinata]|uniref:Organic cation transporter n=1 Tax=Medioppia subpectinata TaxID=1979941 RepID=A0A7R9Q5J4_9ACAR|nr:unnamed protein product [Medioppia subpectinata]CAG2113816.1 unnamed protein product [Medioppia subpectinata]